MPVSSRLVGKAHVEISADLTQLNTALDKAKKEAEQATKGISAQMQAVGNGLAKVGSNLYKNVTQPIMRVGKASLEMAIDAQESENLFEVSMGNMADAAREWSKELSDAIGLNEYDLRKMVGTFNVMFDSMGLATDEAYDMSTTLTELSYDMASFYNLDPEEAFLKLQAGITGEAEALKRLGILVDEATVKQTAYEHGIAAVGTELTNQQKIQGRYIAIMEQTAQAQGDMARTMESPANRLRALREQLEEVGIQFGEALLPALEKALDAFQKLTTWLSNLDEKQKENIIKWALFAAAIGPVLLIVGKLITGIPALVMGFKTLQPVLIALKADMLALLGNPMVLAVAAFTGAIVSGLIDIKRANDAINEAGEKAATRNEARIEEYVAKAEAAARKGYDSRIKTLQDQLNAEDKFMADSGSRWQEYYDEQVNIQKSSLQEQLYNLEDSYNDQIDAIRQEYGYVADSYKSKTDLSNEYYDNEIDRANEAHNEKIRLINEELAEQLKLVDEEAYKQLQELQNQINALDNLTEAEREQQRRRSEQERIASLERAVASAEGDQEKIDAQAELDEYLEKLAYESELRKREIKKDSLKEQMDDIRESAAEEKDELSQAAAEKIAEEEANLETELDLIESRRTAAIQAIQDERKEKEAAAKANYEDTRDSITQQIEELERGEGAFVEGLKREIEDKKFAEFQKYLLVRDSVTAQIAEYQRLADEAAEIAAATAEQEAANSDAMAQQKLIDEYMELNKSYMDLTEDLGDRNALLKGLSLLGAPLGLGPAAGLKKIEDQMKEIEDKLHEMGVAGFASGGVVTEPTLSVIGEDGPEMIVPQDRFNEVIAAAQQAGAGGAVGAAGGINGRVEHVHQGTIKVQGVNDEGELVAAIDIALKDILRQEARAYG